MGEPESAADSTNRTWSTAYTLVLHSLGPNRKVVARALRQELSRERVERLMGEDLPTVILEHVGYATAEGMRRLLVGRGAEVQMEAQEAALPSRNPFRPEGSPWAGPLVGAGLGAAAGLIVAAAGASGGDALGLFGVAALLFGILGLLVGAIAGAVIRAVTKKRR